MFYNQLNQRVNQQDPGISRFFSYIYQNVAIGLGLCGALSFFVSSSPAMLQLFFGTPLKWVIIFAPLGINVFLNLKINDLSVSAAQGLYYLYAGAVGVSISCVFLLYTGSSIFFAFFNAAAVFMAASIYGRVTESDLSRLGNIIFVALIGVIVAMVINIFLQNAFLDMMLSVAMILLMSVLIAFETQNLKNLYYQRIANDQMEKISIFGSLTLFIAFVNIFLSFLRLFGDRRE